MSAHTIDNAKAWFQNIKDMLEDYNMRTLQVTKDEAEQAILESPLSVLVRSGWYTPGDTHKVRPSDGFPLCCLPAEYEILLSTGGPALRIIGDLSEHGEPTSATLQWQDWGTPWTDVRPYSDLGVANRNHCEGMLLSYASHFYFGE